MFLAGLGLRHSARLNVLNYELTRTIAVSVDVT